jgi:hypothetical protein
MTKQNKDNRNSEKNKEDLDLHLEIRLKLSPLAKKLIGTVIEAAKISISIGKVLLPLTLAGSFAIHIFYT